MKRMLGVVLPALVVVLGVAGVSRAASPEEVDARIERLEKRVIQQDKKILALQSKSKEDSAKLAKYQEYAKAITEIKKDAKNHNTTGWLENFKVYGDLRLRYQFSQYGNGNHEKNIGRFRLRVGAKKTWLEKQLEIGFRLATGSSDDPTSTNQSFDNSFSEKQVWIDLAYAKYQPNAIKGFTIIGGKMKNPFVHTNMLWDSDVNPEGVWAVYKQSGLGPFEPFVGFGFFQLEHNATSGDATLHAYQVGNTWKIPGGVKWVSVLSYYDYGRYEEFYSRAKSNTVNAAGNRLSAEEFNVLNVTNKVSWTAFNLPMSTYVDYAHNAGNELGGQSDALAVGYKVGKNKKKGDWSLAYKYAFIQANSTPAAFNDSDFGNTNRKGHQWGGKYNLTDFLTAGANLFYTQPVSGANVGDSEFTLLADLIWKF